MYARKMLVMSMVLFAVVSLSSAVLGDDSKISGTISQNEKIIDSSNDSLSVLGTATANAGSMEIKKSKIGDSGTVKNLGKGQIENIDNSAVAILGNAKANEDSVVVKKSTINGTVQNLTTDDSSKNSALAVLGVAKSNTGSIVIEKTKETSDASVKNEEELSNDDTSSISILGNANSNTGSISVK